MKMCARFIGDMTKFSWKYESGTYASATGTTSQWPGLVQSAEVAEEINKQAAHFINGDSRDVNQMWDQARDVSVNFSTFVQDWRMVGFALGSIVTSGSPYTHTLIGTDSDNTNLYTSGTDAPFISFSAQDAKRFNPTGLNHIKTVAGCNVNSCKLSWSEGNPVTMDVAAIGKTASYETGAEWSATANTARPYMWSDTLFSIPSGTVVRHVKSSSLEINNNLVANHYCNGSLDIEMPYPTRRDLPWELTVDGNTDWAKTFYEKHYKGGSEFNAQIYCGKSSVSKITFTLSGCQVSKMADPSSFEGAQEQTISIIPKTCTAVVVDDIAKYGCW